MHSVDNSYHNVLSECFIDGGSPKRAITGENSTRGGGVGQYEVPDERGIVPSSVNYHHLWIKTDCQSLNQKELSALLFCGGNNGFYLNLADEGEACIGSGWSKELIPSREL